MTKKHFIALADRIRDFQEYADEYGYPRFHQQHIMTLANFCATSNPRFNRERWLNYVNGECGPNGGAVRKQERAA